MQKGILPCFWRAPTLQVLLQFIKFSSQVNAKYNLRHVTCGSCICRQLEDYNFWWFLSDTKYASIGLYVKKCFNPKVAFGAIGATRATLVGSISFTKQGIVSQREMWFAIDYLII